ncbi:MAG: flagellin FliC [Rhodobacteraceae bacterium HLUCCA12]|nr:MAG: flagellin FliC [Rhodobacteraceae bacterium HLUCCA12]
MSSIMTNNGAMVALQTMKQINGSMSKVQGQISTGLKVGSAKDNAATWAISKVMESDVSGFKTIQDSLSLGSSTVNVARNAAETTVKLLTEIKEKIVGAQEQNVDRAKIQTDIDQLRDQIGAVVSSAQFNGLNMVNGQAQNPVSILSSLDRSAGGTVQSGKIEVSLDTTNLTTNVGTALTAAAHPGTGVAQAIADGADLTFAAGDFDFADAGGAAGGAVARRSGDMTAAPTGDALAAGDRVELDVDGTRVAYTVREGDGGSAVLAGLRNQLEAAGLHSSIEVEFDGADFTISNNVGDGDPIDVTMTATRGSGGLSALEGLNVAGTDQERTDALRDIEQMIQYGIDASASFGSAQKRIDIQKEFVGNLMDSMKSGIGSLVDADMEETSARLQALQVQQQLGIQALSIANQQPQNILSLFR